MKTTLLLMLLTIALSNVKAADRLEARLIGTWTAPAEIAVQRRNDGTVRTASSRQMVEMRFATDHRYTWRLRGQSPAVIGTWRIEAGYLITEARPPTREKIVRLTETELVLSDGHAQGRWTRAR